MNTTTVGQAAENNPYFFAYALKDARDPHTYIVVADLEADNIYARTAEEQHYFTIPRESVDKVKDIVLANPQLFTMEALEDFEGDIETESIFYFSDGKQQVEIHGMNMTKYQNLDEAPNAKYILGIFEEIKAILLDAGIDESYLKLTLD